MFHGPILCFCTDIELLDRAATPVESSPRARDFSVALSSLPPPGVTCPNTQFGQNEVKVPGLRVVLVREGSKADTLFNPNVLDQCRRSNAEVAPAHKPMHFFLRFCPGPICRRAAPPPPRAPCSVFSLPWEKWGSNSHKYSFS